MDFKNLEVVPEIIEDDCKGCVLDVLEDSVICHEIFNKLTGRNCCDDRVILKKKETL